MPNLTWRAARPGDLLAIRELQGAGAAVYGNPTDNEQLHPPLGGGTGTSVGIRIPDPQPSPEHRRQSARQRFVPALEAVECRAEGCDVADALAQRHRHHPAALGHRRQRLLPQRFHRSRQDQVRQPEAERS